MESRWIINNLSEEDERCKNSLVEELKISPTLCQLLVQRGIRTMEDARQFFHPQLSHIHDPFLLNDMDKAVERVNRALGKKEKILIYGDYDVDGTTAVALVYKFLQQFYSNIDFYIPDRYDEGYGISYKGIDYASENGFSLIIVLDCGIKAVEKVKYATQRNVDIIICDHHNPDDVL
ncbi:MAG: DHH family phosphoesterase, partial [Paludibacteraceae bacterium]|nr:DHH family phosphoesterase [Paludibacteraceae bacterium]